MTDETKKHVVFIEWPDGGGVHSEHTDHETAYRVAQDLADANPGARVWLDEAVIQRGFIAADEYDNDDWPPPRVNTHDEY